MSKPIPAGKDEAIWTVDANRFLVTEAANLPPGSALDRAAGEGCNAVWLARGKRS